MDESLRIDRLEWDEWNLDHIRKHGLEKADAAELILQQFLAFQSFKGRFLILGPSLHARIVVMIVGQVPGQSNVYYPFSLRPASRKERMLYWERAQEQSGHGYSIEEETS